MPFAGDLIPLVVQLYDGNESKYVKATLQDPDDNFLAGSPVTLTHKHDGLYEDKSITMPDKQWITVNYQVYDDAGLTIPSQFHSNAIERFDLQLTDQDLLDRITILEAAVNSLSSPRPVDLFVSLGSERYIVELKESNNMEAEVIEDSIDIQVDESIIDINQEDSNINISLEECDD